VMPLYLLDIELVEIVSAQVGVGFLVLQHVLANHQQAVRNGNDSLLLASTSSKTMIWC
jgi:hypothetical protein